MNLKPILTTLLIIVTATVFAQNAQWVKSFGGDTYDRSYSVTTDASGNVISTGFFQSSVDIDPGAGISEVVSAGYSDVFIQKLDAFGNFLWARTFGGSESDEGYSVAVDAAGNIYVTGAFIGTVDFDPGAGTTNLVSASDEFEIFVLKLDPAGNFLWAHAFGNAAWDVGLQIAVDAAGNIVVAGYFEGSVDFDPGPGTTELISYTENRDYFLMKMDSDGNMIWAKSFGGSYDDLNLYMNVDAEGNVLATGTYMGTADFDPGAGTISVTSNGTNDVFVLKVDAAGDLVWTKTFGGTMADAGRSICADAVGNVYVAGEYSGTVDFDPGAGTSNLTSAGQSDVFMLKLDASGNYDWVKTFAGAGPQLAGVLTVAPGGDLFIIGSYTGTADFDPGTEVHNLTALGEVTDIYIEKLDASGNFLWVTSMGGISDDTGRDIYIDDNGYIYTTGYFFSTVEFTLESGNITLTSEGGGDNFVQKMSQAIIGVDESGNELNVSVFPNPTSENMAIAFDRPTDHVELELRDMLGKKIASRTFNQLTNTNLVLNGAGGIYFLTIRTPGAERTIRLIKE